MGELFESSEDERFVRFWGWKKLSGGSENVEEQSGKARKEAPRHEG